MKRHPLDACFGDCKELAPFVSLREVAGLTLFVSKWLAEEHGQSYATVFKWFTLSALSSLDAVGFPAAIAGKLAEHGISANIFTGYYHTISWSHQSVLTK